MTNKNPFTIGQSVTRVAYGGAVPQPRGFEVGQVTSVTGIVGPDTIRVADDGDQVWNVAWFKADDASEARKTVKALTERVKVLKAANSDIRSQRDALNTGANKEITRLFDLVAARNVELRQVVSDRDTLATVLDYAIERLADDERERVFGYWDGVKDATDV